MFLRSEIRPVSSLSLRVRLSSRNQLPYNRRQWTVSSNCAYNETEGGVILVITRRTFYFNYDTRRCRLAPVLRARPVKSVLTAVKSKQNDQLPHRMPLTRFNLARNQFIVLFSLVYFLSFFLLLLLLTSWWSNIGITSQVADRFVSDAASKFPPLVHVEIFPKGGNRVETYKMEDV